MALGARGWRNRSNTAMKTLTGFAFATASLNARLAAIANARSLSPSRE
jgi:hypothetical protein